MQQFADRHVRQFIRRLERPGTSSGHRSVKALIADGAELQQRLLAGRQFRLDDPRRNEALRDAVRPYLQLVDAGMRDEHTGLALRDIWRYFRFTWSIPQTPIPGRSLLYLVRDAAHARHAVIGIAALSNCAVQLAPRDRAIGWSASGLTAALSTLFSAAEQRQAHEIDDPVLRTQGIYRWLRPGFAAGADPSTETKRAALVRVFDWLHQGLSPCPPLLYKRACSVVEAPPTGKLTQVEVPSAVTLRKQANGNITNPWDRRLAANGMEDNQGNSSTKRKQLSTKQHPATLAEFIYFMTYFAIDARTRVLTIPRRLRPRELCRQPEIPQASPGREQTE